MSPATTSSISPTSPTNSVTPYDIQISIRTMDNMMNNRRAKLVEAKNIKNTKRNSQLSDNLEDDEDKFSDDSLEETSLPPPAPPPVVPPPPSLSAPVTPSKRHSIAWEVNLDDLCSTPGNGKSAKVRTFKRLAWKTFEFACHSEFPWTSETIFVEATNWLYEISLIETSRYIYFLLTECDEIWMVQAVELIFTLECCQRCNGEKSRVESFKRECQGCKMLCY